jgi:hypothetical protein
MKYAIIKVINGNYSVHAEGFTELASAKTNFHGLCQTLWNASDVITAEVMIVDENLDCVEGYKEFITHEPQPVEPTPEEAE